MYRPYVARLDCFRHSSFFMTRQAVLTLAAGTHRADRGDLLKVGR